jgi:hypothetical protein
VYAADFGAEVAMPRFFYHVSDGVKRFQDAAGALFDNAEAAATCAADMAHAFREDSAFTDYHIEVRDEQNVQITKVFVMRRH